MDSAKLNDWMQVVGIFALVASLVFVGLQMKQTQDIASFEALAGNAERAMAFRQLLGDNANAWAKGCKGEELTDEERTQFGSVYEAFGTNHYNGWASAIRDDLSTLEADVYIRRAALNYYRFPALAEHAKRRRTWLGPEGLFGDKLVSEYRALISSEGARLAEEGHDAAFDISMCGI